MITEFARALIEALATDLRRTYRKELRLPPGIARAAVEELLVRLLVNLDALEAFNEAVMRRFDRLPTDPSGFDGDEQHGLATQKHVVSRSAFLGGLAALSEADLYALLLCPTQSRIGHELLADAHSMDDYGPWWTTAMAGIDPSEMKFTEVFDYLG